MHTYRIRVRGQVDVAELNPMSPHQMTGIYSEPAASLFTICTDQSGMIGMLRHLHNLGIVILSVDYQLEEMKDSIERKIS